MKPTFKMLALAVAAFSVVGFARAQVLQQDSFDSGYVLGDLDGQNGWNVFPGDNLPFVVPGMVTVSTETARSGSRSVKMNATTLFAGEALFAFKPLASAIPSPTANLIISEFWMRYTPSGTGAAFGGYGFDAVGNSLGGVEVDSSTGLTYTSWNVAASALSPLSANTWNRVTVVFNLQGRQNLAFINGNAASTNFGAHSLSNFSDLDFYCNNGGNVGYFDDFKVEQAPLGTIRGQVQLGDYTVSPAGLPVRIRLLNPANGAPVATIQTTLDSTASYSVSTTARGVYDLEVKPWHWTSKKFPSVNVTDNGLFFLQSAHSNGDCDQSDEVDAIDIDAVIADFGSAGMNITDVDGSQEVDAIDIDIVIANFGSTGG